MTPEISEFSYGFALTNEIVGWAPILAAPLFPSLIEEGKAGGGYDVALSLPGIALYLQFKRADCMVTARAREIFDYGLPITLPFYRFKITESGKSDQHELLLALAETNNPVFYAAPRFHELSEINDAWNSNRVADRSIFVSPQSVGQLDDESHHISYDETNAWLCSEPTRMEFLMGAGLLEKLQARLASDPRPLREKLPEIVRSSEDAKRRAYERIAARRGESQHFGMEFSKVISRSEPRETEREIPLRSPRDLSVSERVLRNLSDDAARIFNAQLLVIQPRSTVE